MFWTGRGWRKWAAGVATLLIAPASLRAFWYEPTYSNRSPLDEVSLAEIRGGLSLPNGLEVAIGADMRTMVDGETVMRTVLNVLGDLTDNAQIADAVNVYLPAPGTTTKPAQTEGQEIGSLIIAEGVEVDTSADGSTRVVIDAGDNMRSQIETSPTNSVRLIANGQTVETENLGQTVALNFDQDMALDHGTLHATRGTGGVRITFDSESGVQVIHALGDANIAAVANMTANRVIEHVTEINVRIDNFTPISAGTYQGLNHAVSDSILSGIGSAGP